VEQDHAGLQGQLAQAQSAAAEGDAARGKLKAELRQALADRDEAVRLNLKLQVRCCCCCCCCCCKSHHVMM
jgi:multidrug resistance efflux pump